MVQAHDFPISVEDWASRAPVLGGGSVVDHCVVVVEQQVVVDRIGELAALGMPDHVDTLFAVEPGPKRRDRAGFDVDVDVAVAETEHRAVERAGRRRPQRFGDRDVERPGSVPPCGLERNHGLVGGERVLGDPLRGDHMAVRDDDGSVGRPGLAEIGCAQQEPCSDGAAAPVTDQRDRPASPQALLVPGMGDDSRIAEHLLEALVGRRCRTRPHVGGGEFDRASFTTHQDLRIEDREDQAPGLRGAVQLPDLGELPKRAAQLERVGAAVGGVPLRPEQRLLRHVEDQAGFGGQCCVPRVGCPVDGMESPLDLAEHAAADAGRIEWRAHLHAVAFCVAKQRSRVHAVPGVTVGVCLVHRRVGVDRPAQQGRLS